MTRFNQLLLIEDDPVSAYLAQDAIKETGFVQEVIICAHGKQALDYLNNTNGGHFPELILLDLKMPVMDGYEFLEEYMQIEKLKGKNIHVVVLSRVKL